ncbi:hypothetical protein [Erythrobacter sp. YT30]|uniref:hypothetical protein n=1 Tax=Erythrobacter sp. YT30 TaxID=1735012 RepID=UPI00076BDD46|nr:hypothetical protein [Erythrobacter sp. YT30]KWV92271.1 hypothetical protein AUC45_08215 [Erythrobacter sp. YT30]
MNNFRALAKTGLGVLALALLPQPAFAQSSQTAGSENFRNPAEQATYADLATLAEASEMIVRAEIRRQTTVAPERSPGLAPGFVRLYIEARTQALIAGQRALGESLVYLVDVPLTEKGKVPKLKKQVVILFARKSPSGSTRKATAVQLVGQYGQLNYTPELEARLRPILSDFAARNVPPRITGISDALAVPGNLTGESETQIFLATADGSPVSMSILRRPGQQPAWGVSWGEIIDSSARPPEPLSLGWYRLACALPSSLPSSANLARDANARRLAASDYAFVMEQLGPCERRITDAT